MASSALLAVHGLVVGYGRRPILHGVSLDATQGGITVVLGPNGSGKSTLIKSIAGVLAPWQGRILFDGREIGGVPAHRLVRQGVCLVPQGRMIFPFLTVEENLRMSAYVLRDPTELRQRIESVYAFFPGLTSLRKMPANRLSGGEQTMLALGKALMLRPRLLLLDEPTLGLAPRLAGQVYDRIREIRGSGMTVVMVEQNVRRGLELAHHVILLSLGRKAFEGTREELEAKGELHSVFFGRREDGSYGTSDTGQARSPGVPPAPGSPGPCR